MAITAVKRVARPLRISKCRTLLNILRYIILHCANVAIINYVRTVYVSVFLAIPEVVLFVVLFSVYLLLDSLFGGG